MDRRIGQGRGLGVNLHARCLDERGRPVFANAEEQEHILPAEHQVRAVEPEQNLFPGGIKVLECAWPSRRHSGFSPASRPGDRDQHPRSRAGHDEKPKHPVPVVFPDRLGQGRFVEVPGGILENRQIDEEGEDDRDRQQHQERANEEPADLSQPDPERLGRKRRADHHRDEGDDAPYPDPEWLRHQLGHSVLDGPAGMRMAQTVQAVIWSINRSEFGQVRGQQEGDERGDHRPRGQDAHDE